MSDKPERAIDVGGHGQTQINLSYVLWLEEGFESLQAECDVYKKALERLVEIKDHKDNFGKTKWYYSVQPEAWRAAIKALSGESNE